MGVKAPGKKKKKSGGGEAKEFCLRHNGGMTIANAPVGDVILLRQGETMGDLDSQANQLLLELPPPKREVVQA